MSLLKIPSFLQVQVLLTIFILNTCTTVVYVIFSKNSSQSFHAKRGAKVRIFIFIFQIFFEVFFSIYFFRKTAGRMSDICLDSSNLILFPLRVLNPFHHVVSRISLDCGCKSTALQHILQMFLPLFFQLFFAFPDCQDVINALFLSSFQKDFPPFFWLDRNKLTLQIS